MKTPQDKLFRLIQAMTPAEKRYFKRHYAIARNNLTELFDHLNSQSEYNEEKVKENFSPKFAKNLKVYKIQLQDLIFKSLLSFRNKKDVMAKIRAGLEEVDLLIEKQLDDFAYERLQKVKKLCMDHDAFTYLFEINRTEFQLQHVHVDNIGLSQLPLFEELKSVVKHLQMEYDQFMLGQKLNEMFRKTDHRAFGPQQQEFLSDLINSKLLTTDYSKLSFRSKISYNNSLMVIHKMLNNPEEEHRFRQANVELFRELPKFRDIMPFTYLATLRNALNYNLRFKHFEETKANIFEADTFIQKHPNYHVQLAYFYYGELMYKYELGQFDNLIQESEAKTIQCIKEAKIDQERIALLCYLLLALSYLICKKFREAQNYLRLAQQIPLDTRAYFDEIIFVIEMIIHFETEDIDLMENLLIAFQRRKKSNKGKEKDLFFKELIKLFKALIRDEKAGKKFAKKLHDGLTQFPGERILHIFQHFHLENWLVSLFEKKGLAEVAQLRAAKFEK